MVAGETLDVCAAWQAINNSDNDAFYLTDYDIKLIGPSNRLIAYSSLSNTNVEMLRFVASETGLYQIRLYQYSDFDPNISGDNLALAYIHRDG